MTQVDFYAIDTPGATIESLRPQSAFEVDRFVRARLDALTAIRQRITSLSGNKPSVLVGPEGFFGVGEIRFGYEWAVIKRHLAQLSRSGGPFLLAPGTGIRTRSGRTSSVSRICADGRKLLNVYKVAAAGVADAEVKGLPWQGFMSPTLKRALGDSAFTNASTKTRVAHWQGLPFGVEICNDARIGILHNDNKRPAGGLALVLWQTRGLFLRGSTQSTNDVGHDMFP